MKEDNESLKEHYRWWRIKAAKLSDERLKKLKKSLYRRLNRQDYHNGWEDPYTRRALNAVKNEMKSRGF